MHMHIYITCMYFCIMYVCIYVFFLFLFFVPSTINSRSFLLLTGQECWMNNNMNIRSHRETCLLRKFFVLFYFRAVVFLFIYLFIYLFIFLFSFFWVIN